MEDINKFRGLTINGEWAHGDLSRLRTKYKNMQVGSYISNSCGMPWANQVRPETVGQFIGRNDKNGKDVYVGDIVDCSRYSSNEIYTVIINDIRDIPSAMHGINLNSIDVIGNRHENKDLMKLFEFK
jgi:hypothetical protein